MMHVADFLQKRL